MLCEADFFLMKCQLGQCMRYSSAFYFSKLKKCHDMASDCAGQIEAENYILSAVTAFFQSSHLYQNPVNHKQRITILYNEHTAVPAKLHLHKTHNYLSHRKWMLPL